MDSRIPFSRSKVVSVHVPSAAASIRMPSIADSVDFPDTAHISGVTALQISCRLKIIFIVYTSL